MTNVAPDTILEEVRGPFYTTPFRPTRRRRMTP